MLRLNEERFYDVYGSEYIAINLTKGKDIIFYYAENNEDLDARKKIRMERGEAIFLRDSLNALLQEAV